MRVTFVFIISLFLASCGQELRSPSSRGSSLTEFNSFTCSCSDYRDPVCGTNGSQYVTFLNGCIAQCNGYDYKSGACDPNVGIACDQSTGQVCGIPPCDNSADCPPPQVYSDNCSLTNAGATPVELSQCGVSL